VYRVSGVLNVILGWLMTALIAFATAAVFAWLIHRFGAWAVGGLLSLVIFLISRSFMYHRQKERDKKAHSSLFSGQEVIDTPFVEEQTKKAVLGMLSHSKAIFEQHISGLIQEDLGQLRQAGKLLKKQSRKNTRFRQNLFHILKNIEADSLEAGKRFILAYDLEQDLNGSLVILANTCYSHVANVHAPLEPAQRQQLSSLQQEVIAYLDICQKAIEQEDQAKKSDLLKMKRAILNRIESLIVSQNKGLISKDFNSRNSLLFLTILLETKDMVAIAARFAKL
jgi:hypothetical protein